MTSAAELFFSRRCRLDSRNPKPNLADDAPTIHRRQLHRRSNRSDKGYTQPLRRVFFFGEEYELPGSESNSTDSSRTGGGSSRTVRNRINRSSLIRNEQLPGSVLQARARLLERLHNIHIPENSDLETVNIEFDVQETASKKPPGLSKERISNLSHETYKDLEDDDGIIKASYECCICLEKFENGEKLLNLPCFHKFHPRCLEPWLQSCGDCPYCRTSV